MKSRMNIKLGTKVSLFVGIPFILFLLTAVYQIYDARVQNLAVSKVNANIQLLVTGTELISEIQKERGQSAAFLGGGGSMANVSSQTDLTDTKIGPFLEQMEKAYVSSLSRNAAAQIQGGLARVRDMVNAKGNTGSILGSYTKLVRQNLNLYSEVAESTKLSEIPGFIRGIAILEEGKENAGKLRANMVAVLSNNKAISKEKFNLLIQLKSGVEINLNSPALYVTEKSVGDIKRFANTSEWGEVNRVFDLILSKSQTGDFGIAVPSFLKTITSSVNFLGKVVIHEFKEIAKTGDTIYSNSQKLLWGITVSVLIVSSLLIFFIFKFIGNLNSVFSSLTSGLGKGTGTLAKLASDLTYSSQQIAAGSTQSAAATQECVSSIAEISSMISQTAEFSSLSSQLASQVKEKTEEGGKTMEQMVNSMDEIQKSNQQLQGIIKIIEEISSKTNVINDIVFKTQLLSCNASIESARAGAHGKGFAVVAEEIGNLAQMSGMAAQEIKTLLETSKESVNKIVEETHGKVSEGQRVTNNALEIFKEITEDIESISEKVDQIEKASKEQAHGVTQTQEAMNQLDEAAMMNSTISNKTLTYSKNLRKQSEDINQIINVLQIVVQGDKADESAKELDPIAKFLNAEKRKDKVLTDVSANLDQDDGEPCGDSSRIVDLLGKKSKEVSMKEGATSSVHEEINADDDCFEKTV